MNTQPSTYSVIILRPKNMAPFVAWGRTKEIAQLPDWYRPAVITRSVQRDAARYVARNSMPTYQLGAAYVMDDNGFVLPYGAQFAEGVVL